MTEQFVNRAPAPTGTPDTTLNNGGVLGAGDLSFVVSSVPSHIDTARPFRIRIDNEWIYVGTVTGTTWSNLVRGIEGSAAAAHSDSSSVYCLLTAGAIEDNLARLDGTNQPFSSTITVERDDAPSELDLTSSDENESRIRFRASAGTVAAPTELPDDDSIAAILFQYRNGGGGWTQTAVIRVTKTAAGSYMEIVSSSIELENSDTILDGFLTMFEQGVPPAAQSNQARIFAVDVGGKTALMVQFPSGVAQQLAIEL